MIKLKSVLAGAALLIGSGVLFSGAVMARQAQDSQEEEVRREEIRQKLVDLNKRTFEQYMLHHDTALYDEVALPDYVFVANIGVVEHRDEVLRTAGNLDIASATVTNEEFRLYDGAAVLIGRIDVDGTVLGHPLPPALRYMSVFVHTDGEWRLLARSITSIIDPRTLGAPRDD